MNPEFQPDILSGNEKAAQNEMLKISKAFKEREYVTGNVQAEHENAIKIGVDLEILANNIHSITHNPESEIFCVVEEGYKGVKIEVEGDSAIYEQRIDNYSLTTEERKNIVSIVHNNYKK